MNIQVNEEYILPLTKEHAVSKGWTSATDHEPKGVTWHWTATWDLDTCRRTIGGKNPSRKGEASAHYGIGRSFAEGIHRYVSLENRSWHAGVNQVLRWDGAASNNNTKGSRTTIGVETVNIGYSRPNVKSSADWIEAYSPNGKHKMTVQPWTSEQVQMMIQVGKEIVARWPRISWTDHHGHHDICPGYKEDVAGFPFAEILRAIYDNEHIPDIWTPFWSIEHRQQALRLLGYHLGTTGPNGDGVDGNWGRASDSALLKFQKEYDLVVNGYWTTFVSYAIWNVFQERGISMRKVENL